MTDKIHQLVHGYSRGHSLLASSCKLPESAFEAVVEQSDLSGPLPPSVDIPSYLTAYPVPDTEFFALAKSWKDTAAPRSGCVISHTLLIQQRFWGSIKNPSSLLKLHRQPTRESLDVFSRAIEPPAESSVATGLQTLTPDEAIEFTLKVFSEDLRSVIWFDAEEPERLVMSFASQLWPSLRNSLFARTFSLNPRPRIKAGLQLHFAPRGAQSIFSRISKQCHMSRQPTTTSHGSTPGWIEELAEDLRAGIPRVSYLEGLHRYGHLLGSEPSSVRSIFALRDLACRLSTTPAAAIGILDIIDALEPKAEGAFQEKRAALESAMSAIESSRREDALHCLFLLDARLRRPSFAAVSSEIKSKVAEQVAQLIAAEPTAIDRKWAASVPSDDSSFWHGVSEGIARAAFEKPNSISILGEFPDVASYAAQNDPRVATAYLHLGTKSRAVLIDDVVGWCQRIGRYEHRAALRYELLREIGDNEDVRLLEELFRDLRGEDVDAILDALVESARGLARPAIRNVVKDYVSERFPVETTHWARRAGLLQDRHVADIVAHAFTLSPDGLERVLTSEWPSTNDACELWAAFIQRIVKGQPPQWFVRQASEDVRFIDRFGESSSWSARTEKAVLSLLNSCDYLPIVRSAHFTYLIERASDANIAKQLIERTVDSAVAEHVRGVIDDDRLRLALQFSPCQKWCNDVPPSRIRDLLTQVSDHGSWQRAWQTVAILPQTLFQRVVSLDLIDDFIRSYRSSWTESVERNWKRILVRGGEELPSEKILPLNFQATAFCFRHTRHSVGRVLLAAFPPVYEAVTTNRAAHITDDLFGWFDWDKAKRFRRGLIDAFVDSCWPPEELALIGARCDILRKLVHRLQRKRRGEAYVQKIMKELRNCGSSEARSVAAELSEILSDPDFFEAWD